jgi:hypothetical protein
MRPLIRSRVLRFALALTAMVQLGTMVLIAADSAREARGAAAHVEAPGGRKHYVHDESRCVACVAHHLFGDAQRPVGLGVAAALHVASPREARTDVARAVLRSPAAPRAPPAVPSL